MENDFDTPTNFSHNSARRFVGYALRHNAATFYAEINSPSPDNIARRATLHLTTQGLTDGTFGSENMINREDRAILTNGINDTRGIIQTAFDQLRPAELSEALSLVRHPQTILAIARLALRDEDALTNLIKRHGQFDEWQENFYRTSRDVTHIEAHPYLAISQESGCPMASHHGEVAPDPLFSRFVPWAGELTVRSLYLHKYKKDQ